VTLDVRRKMVVDEAGVETEVPMEVLTPSTVGSSIITPAHSII
jgi:hypothetical protein